MTTKELREKYFFFFQNKGHHLIDGASLIPQNDPTVLFTTAGMHPLVPYLLGEEHPAGKRLVNVQKCIRTGDIDEVGDDWHLTFFEMLGNWSLGDYFKATAIQQSFDFLTKELGIPPEKLAVSCFAGEPDNNIPKDEEAANIWRQTGIANERIVFLGREDNWWG
ncbi:MAG TPA: alanine--tRNA ligase-related protein, partial [bacterium]|nr:alanine--tRNA ligase-related protein [bacterium]